MIVDAVLGLVVGLLRTILSWLPNWTPPESGFGFGFGQVAGLLNGFFPVTVLMGCILAVLGFRVALTLWAAVVFIYDRFPMKFT